MIRFFNISELLQKLQWPILTWFCVTPLAGTDYKPWSERDLELYPRAAYAFQHYSSLACSSGTEYRSSNDHFLSLELSGSYSVYSVAVEAEFADTRHRSFGFDHARLTGRYQWQSDIIGDPLSLTWGASFIVASRTAVHDVSSFHHGEIEGEFFASIGKECTCGDSWRSRWWNTLAIGLGNRGSPWIFSEWAWEKQVIPYEWGLFANFLCGLGNHTLSVHEFQGYGSIRHRSLDLGIRLRTRTLCDAIIQGEVLQRVWACNYPRAATLLLISYTYPFGL